MSEQKVSLGKIIKQQRLSIPLTLQELTAKSGVSSSHLGRIERGERFPSARVLQKISGPLDFKEEELLTLAGYMTAKPSHAGEDRTIYVGERLDPYVARVLAQEPVDIQRAVIGILTILKGLAKSAIREKR